MSEYKIPIIIICSIDNKPMDFHDAFMDIKGFIDPRLETVCLFTYSFTQQTLWVNTHKYYMEECMQLLVCLLNLLEMDI